MYLASTTTQSKHDFWLIDSGASFHMTPHSEWFYEYEMYNGNVFLGDDSPNKIRGCGRVIFFLNDGRIKMLLGCCTFQVWSETSSINKMGDAGVRTEFEKDGCKMV